MAEIAPELSVADVLERAADMIEPEGAWIQRAFVRTDESGRECFCAMGAIAEADTEDLLDGKPVEVFRQVIGSDVVTAWNDAPERTQAEVVAKLREAAALARERQS